MVVGGGISMSNIIRNKTIWGKKPVSGLVEVCEINYITQFAFTGNLLLPGAL